MPVRVIRVIEQLPVIDLVNCSGCGAWHLDYSMVKEKELVKYERVQAESFGRVKEEVDREAETC